MAKAPANQKVAAKVARGKTTAVLERSVGATTEAYGRLRELIITGRLSPGAPLIETDLSVRLGVSRTPIRAALQRLQQEGFVIGSRVGHMVRAVVSPLTAEDMSELFMMVGALEGVAAYLASSLDTPARMRLVERLEEHNRRMKSIAKARGEQPILQAQDLHEQFHQTVARAAAGPRLRAELESLRPQAERYGRAYTSAAIGEFEASLSEHEAVIAAIREGDSAAAERLMTENWRNGAERFRRIVELHGERGRW
jgi:DNA-binding GntR family transcriptional regulator